MESNRCNVILLMAFIALATIGIFHHEIWLDEAQNWLQARDNTSISSLYTSLRYEGHPLTWNFLLFLITRITHNVIWMQILHLAIIIVAVAIFLFHSPFRVYQKALFIFGYFIFYEYALISRNYSLMILFLFLIAWCYNKDRLNYILVFFLLTILANTHLLGLLLSISIASHLIIRSVQEKIIKEKSTSFIIGVATFILGVSLAVLQIIPPEHTPIVLTHFSFVESVTRIVPVFIKGFVPIPDIFNYHFWNTNLFISTSKPLASILSVALFLVPAIFFNNKKGWLIAFYLFTFLVFCVFVIIKLPAVRYAGIIYIFFIFCLWISDGKNEKAFLPLKISQRVLDKILTSLLVTQVIAGMLAFSFEIIRPFSESKNVALYLEKEGLLNLDILGEFCESSMFLTYIDKQSYYLDLKNYGSYCHLKEGEEVYNIGLDTMLAEAYAYTKLHKADALFIHYKQIPLNNNLILVKSFTNSVVNNENFYIYKVLYKP